VQRHGVVVEVMEYEQVDNGHRADATVSLAAAVVPAEMVQRLGLENRGDLISDPVQGVSR
jgi:hypothetical protein